MEILWQSGTGGGGSGTGFDGIVTVFSELPVDDSADVGEVWLVRESEGAWFFGRKQRGLYQRIDDTGVRETDWQYLGEWQEEFSDANFQVYNASDETKVVKLDVSAVSTATTRTLIVPNQNGTIALLSDLADYQPLLTPGNSITIISDVIDTVQDIRTAAAPQFAGLTLTGGFLSTKSQDALSFIPASGTDGAYAYFQNNLTSFFFGMEGTPTQTGFAGILPYDSFIGTADPQDLVLVQSGTVRARLTATGMNAMDLGQTTPGLGNFTNGGFSGTFTLANKTANTVFAGPTSGGAAAPAFRALVAADIPSLSATSLTMATARILGRTTASTGAVEELTVGSSLSLAAGSLNTIQDIRTTATPQFGAILIGSSTSYGSPLGFTPSSIITSTGAAGSALMGLRWSTNAAGSRFVLAKSNSGTLGTQGALTVGQENGELLFAGSDGTDIEAAVSILGVTEVNAASNDMRSALVVRSYTANTGTEVARFTFGRNLLIGTTSETGVSGPGKIKALGIEGTPIGAVTTSTGAFTTLAASGNVTYTGPVNGGFVATDGTVTGIIFPSGAAGNSLVVGTVSNHPLILFSNNAECGRLTTTGFQGAIGATTPSPGAFTTLTGTSIQTANPSGGTAQPWKLGSRVTGVTATVVGTEYVQLDINGTLVKLAVVTSVP